MLFFWLFLLTAALAAAAVSLAGGPWWLALIAFVLGYVLALVLTLLVFRLLTRRTDLSQPNAVQNRIARAGAEQAGQLVCAFGGVRPAFRGLDKLPEGRFLFVCNHRSLFDPLMVMGYLQRYNIQFISKPSNLRIPLAGAIARTAGFLAIDRENDRKALQTILTAADYLRRGICSIGIYPEGTRSHTRELLPFHSGSFKIAQRAHVPLVIACVHGTEKLRRGLLLHPHRCTLEILDCVPADRVKAMKTQELAAYSRELMEKALKEAEA
jgi:1-acyl-sn-glycerol-3-phosphate acyltransferase